MKIAVLGSASSSLPKAPFQNQQAEEFRQGKISSIARAHAQLDGEWDIWGCSPGCWAVVPRATRWFEVHRWEPGQTWFSPEYCQFLRDFKGIVYTGGVVPEIPNHLVYPIDRLEEKFSSYFMQSSLSLMLASAIETIEEIRAARKRYRESNGLCSSLIWDGVEFGKEELEKDDEGDVIGLWGVDMAAAEEYGYQRPGCQFFLLEAMRRGIGVFLPPESDLMRPKPVYGISEWDHNYIKLTSRAKELNSYAQQAQAEMGACQSRLHGVQGEMHALTAFVDTWTSPYGMQHGMVIRQTPGTGLGSGITHFDGRPVSRMAIAAPTEEPQAAPELAELAAEYRRQTNVSGEDAELLRLALREAEVAREHSHVLQPHCLPGESTSATIRRLISERDAALAPKRKKAKRRK